MMSPSPPQHSANASHSSHENIDYHEKTPTLEHISSCNKSLDSGYGWVVIISSFIISFIVNGTLNSYATFMQYYRNDQFAGTSSVALSMVGSASSACTLLFGELAGWGADNYGIRTMVFIGNIFVVSGLSLASFATKVVLHAKVSTGNSFLHMECYWALDHVLFTSAH